MVTSIHPISISSVHAKSTRSQSAFDGQRLRMADAGGGLVSSLMIISLGLQASKLPDHLDRGRPSKAASSRCGWGLPTPPGVWYSVTRKANAHDQSSLVLGDWESTLPSWPTCQPEGSKVLIVSELFCSTAFGSDPCLFAAVNCCYLPPSARRARPSGHSSSVILLYVGHRLRGMGP